MRRLSLPNVLLALCLSASAASAAPAGFAFLEVPAGARGAALGGAYASLASGPEAAFWNPAGLAAPKGLEVAGGHSELLESLRHDYFAVDGRLFGGGASASIRALYSEPIDERDELGNLIGSFGAHDLELAIGYGRKLSGGLAVGGSTALVRERIANLSATTYSFGAGASWDVPSLEGLRFALVAQNLGPAASYTIDGIEGNPVDLPTAVQGGASYALSLGTRAHVAAALEGRMVRGRSGMAFTGAELNDVSGASLRLGYRANDTASSFSFGVGYDMGNFGIDYAFVPLKDDLGETHRLSFDARF